MEYSWCTKLIENTNQPGNIILFSLHLHSGMVLQCLYLLRARILL
ncbi:hypothetical protein yberc0001_31850 [Yersinia bercovieri ATCC 43970]|uniref:Uncharacterized protein n=1 Tax=Yersinia bercovieri ATCC 43970 TaxID=349968 RepID=A0ABM9Y100_YERBE|nr:hypothetical protein yberc0001_31850 [Yersinia bercovieri ATCC 43970]